jgi:hypothetical protein
MKRASSHLESEMNDTEKQTREDELRKKLGIPSDAKRVLVLGETSHWDPNWLFTSEEYYRRRIERILDDVIAELEHEPRRIFSIESLFFLRLYWQRRPEQRATLQQLVNEGRLQLTGTGITTPDTVLPPTEAILRDYLLGQEWLRNSGMTVEPRLAYLPDDFGYSPALPAIFSALGFDRVGITRIDGMYFLGADFRMPSSYPLPDSSAYLLTKTLRTQDFVWRAPDGSEVLCHWNAFTYFQGDMLAHLGVIRWMGMTLGVPWRTGRHIASRIDALVRKLAPLSRTPYLFCPIGCDFNGPIHKLVTLLDRYNRTYFQDTGTWVLSAGMNDHLALVDEHRTLLPVLELDPNPYWMGFYATRPNMKRLCSRVVRKLVLAEKLAFGQGAERRLKPNFDEAWDLVAVSNHHDFITGTSPERVFMGEQLPWLRRAEALANTALERVHIETESTPRVSEAAPEWSFADGKLEIYTTQYTLVLSENDGGCITSYRTNPDGEERLLAPSNDLIAYADSGGLWRMGHEYRGGHFREIARASQSRADIDVSTHGEWLEVAIHSKVLGERITRRMWLKNDWPIIRMHVDGVAKRHTTITCRFTTNSLARTMTMNVPGGVLERPMRKLYDPTFWPARSFAHFEDVKDWGFAVFLGGPACISMSRAGVVEWVVLRNAPFEKAFGFLPLPAHPASGVGTAEDGVEYSVWFTRKGDYRAHHLPRYVRTSLRSALLPFGSADLDSIANSQITTTHPDVLVTAIKPASRGPGTVLRLRSYRPHERIEIDLRCAARRICKAHVCDARERDIEDVTVDDGAAKVVITRAITSIRLLFDADLELDEAGS